MRGEGRVPDQYLNAEETKIQKSKKVLEGDFVQSLIRDDPRYLVEGSSHCSVATCQPGRHVYHAQLFIEPRETERERQTERERRRQMCFTVVPMDGL